MISSASSEDCSQSRLKFTSNIFPFFSGLSLFSSSTRSFSATQYRTNVTMNISSESIAYHVNFAAPPVLSAAYIHIGNTRKPVNAAIHGRNDASVIFLSIPSITSSSSPSHAFTADFILPYITNVTINKAAMATVYTIGSVTDMSLHIESQSMLSSVSLFAPTCRPAKKPPIKLPRTMTANITYIFTLLFFNFFSVSLMSYPPHTGKYPPHSRHTPLRS